MLVKGKTVLVIGAAKSGKAAAQFLVERGAQVVLNDIKKREEFSQEDLNTLEKNGVTLILGRHADCSQLWPELVVMSPGVSLDIPPVAEARGKNIPVISELELAANHCQAMIIAITGTNGKTTTTALTGQIFLDAGRSAFVAGNIGVPFISKAGDLTAQDVAVLEASSFQLETTKTFKPKVAAVLNITPDHLDRHGSLAGYAAVKAKVFANQDGNDWLILNWDDEETRKMAGSAHSQVIFFSRRHILKRGVCVEKGWVSIKLNDQATPVIRPEEILIKGSHNLENALAALAAGYVAGVPVDSLKKTLQTFPGVEHRLENVLVHDGVLYVNDSKGTNPDAAIKALEAFDKPIVLLAGGKNKGSDFTQYAEKIREKAKAVVLVGQAKDEIKDALERAGWRNYVSVDTFEEAVRTASSLAQSGDVVLLSPACASWDMFDNFEQRGEVFKGLVRRIADGK